MTFTLQEARSRAVLALRSQDYALALRLGYGLLQADPKDSEAHYIVAVSQAGLGRPAEARISVRRAFQTAPKETPKKFFAAQTAAQLALKTKRYTASQYWLRRSLAHAPNERLRNQTISDFRQIKSLKPVSFSGSFSIVPSDNVNSGTDDPYLIIDGLPAVGILSASSRPLSGIVARANVRFSYRLAQNEKSHFQLNGRVYHREVMLSSASKATGVSNDELSSATYELGLSHMRIGQNGSFNRYGFELGRNYSGRSAQNDYARLSFSHTFRSGDADSLTLGATYRHIRYNTAILNRASQIELRGDYRRKFASGDTLQSGLILGQTHSERGNVSQSSATAYVTYGFDQKVGPAEVSVTLGAKYADYPRFFIGFLSAPGGRQDSALFGTIDLRIADFETAGFVPTVSLQLNKTSSNISRYETESASIAIGFASSF